MLEKAFKFLREIFQRSLSNDIIGLGEEIRISLVKDGKTIRVFNTKGHTWNSTGLHQIREWLRTGSANRPNSLTTNGSGSPYVSANPYQPTESTVAGWKGTFSASGSITDISTISLCHNGTAYSSSAVTTFTKPDGVEMRIDWRTTLSAS